MDNLLSVQQVATMLHVHPLTVRRYIRTKRLQAVKVGGNIRISEQALQNFHKEIAITEQKPKIFKNIKLLDKQFTQDDPLFRLQGRGAGIEINKT
jgi:excisionase family DNA binding protein